MEAFQNEVSYHRYCVGNAVHITQRVRTSSTDDLVKTVVNTGKAVMMSILTTLVRFGRLIFANHLGMEELGKMIVLGLGICLVLIITLLSALFAIFRKKAK
ncbi:hypothetical protein [Pseudogracilibacillus auburnensis]|uniref:hypothetical protein n=1 Tax=Pseudogracilibacillus auburnensis TaxID=1494959 RepID=UPI001A958C35|nr:hypothetical protein [Pseudogracilibacillus auburnensis]MBO1001334.1 hypothetical protein [Pseudogracilibacillus auburnensis]